jgi:hypothetical protein
VHRHPSKEDRRIKMNEHMKILVRELLDFASQAVSDPMGTGADDLVQLHRKLAAGSIALLGLEADVMTEGATRNWVVSQREALMAYRRDSK